MPLVPVDVQVNTVESRVRVTDADALLSPEILQKITAALVQRLEANAQVQAARESDTRVDHETRPSVRRL